MANLSSLKPVNLGRRLFFYQKKSARDLLYVLYYITTSYQSFKLGPISPSKIDTAEMPHTANINYNVIEILTRNFKSREGCPQKDTLPLNQLRSQHVSSRKHLYGLSSKWQLQVRSYSSFTCSLSLRMSITDSSVKRFSNQVYLCRAKVKSKFLIALELKLAGLTFPFSVYPPLLATATDFL